MIVPMLESFDDGALSDDVVALLAHLAVELVLVELVVELVIVELAELVLLLDCT